MFYNLKLSHFNRSFVKLVCFYGKKEVTLETRQFRGFILKAMHILKYPP